MGIAARKRRAYQERDDLILNAARTLLLKRGYHGLTMDRIAEAIEYSKATVYQHFHCKEEVISTLAKNCLEIGLSMMQRAFQFDGRTRERMTALGVAGELFTRVYAQDVHILHVIQTQAITEKASVEIQAAMRDLELKTMALMTAVTQDAIAVGDLVLPPHVPPEELSFGLYTIVIGGQVTTLRGLHMDSPGIGDPLTTVLRLCQALGDGYGWRPLSSEWNYDETRTRICETVFRDECEKLRNLPESPIQSLGAIPRKKAPSRQSPEGDSADSQDTRE